MRRVLETVRLWVLGAVVVLLAGIPAHASAAYSLSSHSVPVTTPDTLGAPVSLDTDVYVPDTAPPPGGFPLLEIFHGGGSTKDNAYDAAHARRFADDGYVVLSYSARGHGDSGGQTTVAGPAEIRDLFDVTAWALGRPDFHIDRARIALRGYSQGGLHTNLGQVWSGDPSMNPYGISFRALEPGNTPDLVFSALVPNSVLKLSFGVGLIGTYLGGSTSGKDRAGGGQVDRDRGRRPPAALRVRGPLRPIDARHGDEHDAAGPCLALGRLSARAASGCPGSGRRRSMTASSRRTWRSRCGAARRTPTSIASTCRWAATPRPRRTSRSSRTSSTRSVASSMRSCREGRFRGRTSSTGRGIPTVEVPADSYAYPPGAWRRQTADSWPPAKVAGRDVSPRRRRHRDAGLREQRADTPLAADRG